MRLFKPRYRDRKTGQGRTAAKWYVELTDHMGTRRRIPGFADKGASESFGRRLERLAAHRATGEPLPKDMQTWLESLAPRMQRRLADIGLFDRARAGVLAPLAEHIEAYRAHLTATGASARYVKLTVAQVERVVAECGFRYWPDIRAGVVVTFLNGLRGDTDERRGISAKSFNGYVGAMKAFCSWMVKDSRASESPMRHVKPLNVQVDRRHVRRALSIEEIRWLLDTTAKEPERFGMTGADRALLYRVAIETGIRAGELESLTRESFDLAGKRPAVKVAAACSKHRRDDVVPLRPDTAAALAARLESVFAGQRIFKIGGKGARMLRDDLEAGRRAWIADEKRPALRRERVKADFLRYKDAAGRFLDFHSLRHTTGTLLAAAQVHPKTAQAIMRHSTIGLTMNLYTHADAAQEAVAVAALPSFGLLRATGTDGDTVAGESDLAICLPKPGGKGRIALNADGFSGAQNGEEQDGVECSEKVVSGHSNVSGGEAGIRTRGTGINPYNRLATCRFRPLSHLSGDAALVGPQGFEPRTNGL